MMKAYGIIGYPLEHSFSERYFNKRFTEEEISAVYKNFPLTDIKLFRELIKKNQNLFGLSVTTPYKQEIINYLDEISEEAKAVNAVNLIKIEKHKELILKGYNTDIYGFQKSIENEFNKDIHSALIIGTGGAARAVELALKNLNIESTYVSRRKSNYLKKIINYKDLTLEIFVANRLIINATPLGMLHDINTYPLIPYQFFTKEHIAYDLIYNPAETIFLKKAYEKGASCINGKKMLIYQAEKAREILNI